MAKVEYLQAKPATLQGEWVALVSKVQRNPGTQLHYEWLRGVHVNLSAVERRVATLCTRRTVKKDWQLAWLLKAITCIDLTTLAGDDSPGRVQRLCEKARRPLRSDLVAALGVGSLNLTTGAVCVYHNMIEPAMSALKGCNVPVAAVSTGFPAGQSPLAQRLAEISASVAIGADEIDIVISRAHVFSANWQALYDEVKAFRAACGPAHMKAIIATGDLSTLRNVAKASMVCMMAGADFIKTSTGMESSNANLVVSLVMVRMIRSYLEKTGFKIGFKPAGGIRTAKDVLSYFFLIKEELDNSWLNANLLRIGASGLLADIERQLDYHISGGYSVGYRHPLG